MPESGMRCDLDKPHGLVDEGIRGFGEKGIMGFAVDRFAADLKQHGNRKRRYHLERPMYDLAADAFQHDSQTVGIDQPIGGIIPGGAQAGYGRVDGSAARRRSDRC